MTDQYDRQRLVQELGDKLANASGYAANVNDVKQWEVAADAIIHAIEGVVAAKILEAKVPDSR